MRWLRLAHFFIYTLEKFISIYIGEIMSLKKFGLNRRRKDRYTRQKRQELFTWLHRYLRLHNELLADESYQIMYDYVRATLIAYLQKDVEGSNGFDDETLGRFVDRITDIFVGEHPEYVEKYKPYVILFHDVWDGDKDLMKDIKV